MKEMLSGNFKALIREAQFTNEMLGAGATEIRKANYATKGIYFQAFSSLSTGLERIGKLSVIVDYCISNSGRFPSLDYLKNKLGHDVLKLYGKSKEIATRRSIKFSHLNDLDGDSHQAILRVLSSFAQGDRYSNIDMLVGNKRGSDPIDAWHKTVDVPLFEGHVSNERKRRIRSNAKKISKQIAAHSYVLHVSEENDEIVAVEDASYRTGVFESTAPYRQLYVVQVIRYWAELLSELHYIAARKGNQDIPHFGEIFGRFCTDDRYIRARKTWDRV
jgi:hypothetical protein